MVKKENSLQTIVLGTLLLTSSCSLVRDIKTSMKNPDILKTVIYQKCHNDPLPALENNKTSYTLTNTVSMQIQFCDECVSQIKGYDSGKEKTQRIYCDIYESGSLVSSLNSTIPKQEPRIRKFDWSSHPGNYNAKIIDYRGRTLKEIPQFSIVQPVR